MADFSFSDSSSELSVMSRSPTPPFYPSPPASQLSSRTSPGPDVESSTCTSSAEEDDSRPSKRPRLSSNMPRPTKRLDLREFDRCPTPDQQIELDRLLKALRKNRKIVVVAGAGISVSAGIPDFRSSTGLFKSLKAQYNLKGSGKHLFDAAVYRDSSSTSSFHDMVRSLSTLTKSAKPTPFHHLIARLASEDRLLRLYSQNVDGIDTSLQPLATEVPLPKKGPWPKTIQLHGGLEKMICIKCNHLADFEANLFDGPVPPDCEECKTTDINREIGGKRSHGIGRLRPRMVLYNEHNPDDEAIGAVTKADLRKRPDAIIVVGTSLKIPGVKRIVKEMCSIVRNHRDGLAVWINNDPEPSSKEFEDSWDLIVKGTCDEVARYAALRQWNENDLKDSKVVTDEEFDLAKEKSRPTVVLKTPISTRFKDVDLLPTPGQSPGPLKNLLSENSDSVQSFSSTISEVKSQTSEPEALKHSKIKLKLTQTNGTSRSKTGGNPKKSRPRKNQPSKLALNSKSGDLKRAFKVEKNRANAPEILDVKKAQPLDTINRALDMAERPFFGKKEEGNKVTHRGGPSIPSTCELPQTSAVKKSSIQTTMKLQLTVPRDVENRTWHPSHDEISFSPQRPPVEPLTPCKPKEDPSTPSRPIPSPLTVNKLRHPLHDSTRPPNQYSIPFELKQANC